MNSLDRVDVAKAIRGFLDEIRPSDPAVRRKLDFGFRFYNKTIEIFSIRPRMLGRPGKIESEIAKATFVKSREVWKVYWMRGNGKWFPYDPPTVGSLNSFLKLVKQDKHHCFFG